MAERVARLREALGADEWREAARYASADDLAVLCTLAEHVFGADDVDVGAQLAAEVLDGAPPIGEEVIQHDDALADELLRSIAARRARPAWLVAALGALLAVLRCWRDKLRAVVERDASMPADWYTEPFYYAYVQYCGTSGVDAGSDADDAENDDDDVGDAAPGSPGAASSASASSSSSHHHAGTFATFERMLPFIRNELGVRNVYVLPHYESPLADHGYDVSAFHAARRLGGEACFERFMARAAELGMRVVTDGVFNHTSVEHVWFARARRGHPRYLRYYVLRDDWRQERIEDRNGDLFAVYRDTVTGVETTRILIFPDVSRDHLFRFATPDGRAHQAYRTFYPFQIDLDLRNPVLFVELAALLARETALGTAGKRMDAIAHWIKAPGTYADGLPETHALHALFKLLLRMMSPKAVLVPEAVRTAHALLEYIGVPTTIGAGDAVQSTTTEGDALFNFHLQAVLRETLYFQSASAWWDYYEWVESRIALPPSATWLNLLGHHDETYCGFFREHQRNYLRLYMLDHGGMVYKNGMSAGGRYYEFLNRNPQRMALAFFVLFALPGTPAVYYGDDVGVRHARAHAARMQRAQHAALSRCLEHPPTLEQAFDPRELHRGPVPAALYERRARERFPPLRVIARMTALRRSCAALAGRWLHGLETGSDEILGFVKYTPAEAPRSSGPIIVLANLSHRHVAARLPVAQVRGEMWQFEGPLALAPLLPTDLCTPSRVAHADDSPAATHGDVAAAAPDAPAPPPRGHRAAFGVVGDRVVVPLGPYEFQLLAREADARAVLAATEPVGLA